MESETLEKRERVRLISQSEQEALELAPFFEALRELLYQCVLRVRERHSAQASTDSQTTIVA